MITGKLARVITMREALMAAAPLGMLVFLRVRGAANVTRGECVGVTCAGAALLVVNLVGTSLWARAGLPRGPSDPPFAVFEASRRRRSRRSS